MEHLYHIGRLLRLRTVKDFLLERMVLLICDVATFLIPRYPLSWCSCTGTSQPVMKRDGCYMNKWRSPHLKSTG